MKKIGGISILVVVSTKSSITGIYVINIPIKGWINKKEKKENNIPKTRKEIH
jgi:hypothetical protein